MAENTEQVKINSKKNTNFIYAIGRRKQASARARLYQEIKSSYDFKKGDIFVNGKKASEYFKGELARLNYIQPLQIVDAVVNMHLPSKFRVEEKTHSWMR